MADHAEAAHAVLSPSSAERWIACPPSVQLCATMPPESESIFAAEGTHAHEVHDLVVQHRLGHVDKAEFKAALADWRKRADASWDTDEMLDYADTWADMLMLRRQESNGVLFTEKRLNTGIEGVWGTSDAVIIEPTERRLSVIDLKYGMGVRVEAEGNPQLRLYALGALENYDGLLCDIETVCVTVWQPRLGHESSECLSTDELLSWRDEVVKPAAALALAGEGEFNPGIKQCRWCPAAGRCEAQVKKFAAIDFASDPALLGPADLADLIALADQAREWATQVHDAALKLAVNDGEDIPGYKLVRSAGRRSIKDHAGAVEALHAVSSIHNVEPLIERRVVGITALEKALGKDEFNEILGEFVVKSEGKISLVPEGDKRPALDRNAEARQDFS